jgi:hypothetical protein
MGDNGGYSAFDSRDLEKSTVATWLDAVGYRTIYLGKYMNNFNSQVHANPPGWDVFGTPTAPYQVGETKAATTANRAMAQLRQDVPKAEPVFLQVGFDAPHVPNDYETQYSTMFVGERVPGCRVSTSRTCPTNLATSEKTSRPSRSRQTPLSTTCARITRSTPSSRTTAST